MTQMPRRICGLRIRVPFRVPVSSWARQPVLPWHMPVGPRDPETYAIIGAAMRVHRALGAGFLEAVYHDALGLALETDGVPCQREVPFRLQFEGRPLRTSYRADLVCFGQVLVELKALRALTGAETAQVLNYLKASGLQRALLLNFGTPRLEYRRLVATESADGNR